MTAVMVELCACGHSPRMHERDEDAEGGRGVCAHRSCGCSGYRPASVEVQQPAEPLPEEAPAAAPRLQPAAVAAEYVCRGCDRSFTTKQALGGHTSRAHRTEAPAVPPTAGGLAQPPEAAKQGPSVDRSSAPATEADHEGVLAPVGTATTREDPAVTDGDAPVGTAGHNSVVHPDDVLVGLVRALEAVVDGEPSVLLEQALDIRRYMDDHGWRLIDAGATPPTTTGATP